MRGTGCAGFGAEENLIIRRAIEAFDINPEAKTAVLWCSVFIENTGSRPAYLTVIHRGALRGENLTQSMWGPGNTYAAIRDRIEVLHKENEPIEVKPGIVSLEGEDYPLYKVPDGRLTPKAGGEEHEDAPFTLWRLGPFPENGRRFIQFRLEINPQSLTKQMGEAAGPAYLYGDAVLLNHIKEDLGDYEGSDRETYAQQLDEYRPMRRVPEIFEYMLISDSPETLFKATPLSPNFSHRWVPEAYRKTTHWFMAWHNGEMFRDNGFCLKIEPVGEAKQLPHSEPACPNQPLNRPSLRTVEYR